MQVAKQLNISESQIKFDRMEADAALDAISDSVKDSLSKNWLDMSLKCVSKGDILQRILRKLQIRGVVSWRVFLHLSDSEVKHMNFHSYVKLLTEQRESFFNKTELKMQKKQAYGEALLQIPMELIRELDLWYHLDNEMFGFEDLFTEQFNHRHTAPTGVFDYKKPWNLTSLFT